MIFVDFLIRRFKIIGLIMFLTFIIHLLLGKSRWQYYPIYGLGILYFFLLLYNTKKGEVLSVGVGKSFIFSSILLIVLGIISLLAFPKEKIPEVSGPFKIGTVTYDLIDESREEIYSRVEGDKRRVKYQIWYPAEKTVGYKRAKWISDGRVLTRQLAKSMHLASFMLDHTADIDSNSYYRAPIDESVSKYPLVVISHGWKGFRELHTDYAESLASNGFIVVSIDHTFGSQAVKFKDGSVSYLNKEALPNETDPVKYKYSSNKLVTTYGEDVLSVLNDLEKLNMNDKFFKTKLDLDSIGLLGHSTGGAGDVHAALKDRRINSLLGLDAWVDPIESSKLKEGLEQKALFLSSEQWSRGPNINAINEIIKNSDKASLIQIDGTNHVDFSMSYMYSPLTKYIGFTGSLGGRKSSQIQREIILTFFNKTLKQKVDNPNDSLKEIVDKYEVLTLK